MQFCDLTCTYAAWAEKEALDGSGSCMTFQALYCRKRNMHVHKNMPCAEKERLRDLSSPNKKGFTSDKG